MFCIYSLCFVLCSHLTIVKKRSAYVTFLSTEYRIGWCRDGICRVHASPLLCLLQTSGHGMLSGLAIGSVIVFSTSGSHYWSTRVAMCSLLLLEQRVWDHYQNFCTFFCFFRHHQSSFLGNICPINLH